MLNFIQLEKVLKGNIQAKAEKALQILSRKSTFNTCMGQTKHIHICVYFQQGEVRSL